MRICKAPLWLCLLLAGCGQSSGNNAAHEAAARRATEQAAALGVTAEMSVELKPGVPLAFRLVPGGRFIMGLPPGDKSRTVDDLPAQEKELEAFYISTHEVSQLQFSSIAGFNPSIFQGGNLPVQNLGYEHADLFCRKVAEVTGLGLGLPTEAQWEYACRAGTSTPYHTGTDAGALAEAGWYQGNAHEKVQPVGLKKPNAWGLYDMHGNVWEWCQDQPAAGDKTQADMRTVRGGSFTDKPEFCRATSRVKVPRDFRNLNLGFRVVMPVKEVISKNE